MQIRCLDSRGEYADGGSLQYRDLIRAGAAESNFKEGYMKTLEIVIRVIAGVILVISIAMVALIAMLRSQRDILPQIGGFYVELAKNSDMMPTAPEGALILLKEKNPYVPGDIVAYLDDRNQASISRIISIDGKTEDVSFEVPYEQMMNELGTPGMSTESVMQYDPDVVLKGDNTDKEVIVAADRIMAKSVFISAVLGMLGSMYEHTVWAFLIIIASAVICLWPFRHMSREPKYKEQDIDGPWIE